MRRDAVNPYCCNRDAKPLVAPSGSVTMLAIRHYFGH